MNDITFLKTFHFHTVSFSRYHYTDNRAGSPYHYLAYMEKGRCKIVSDQVTIHAGPGEIFYIPEGLPYQSYWYSDDDIRFKSFGFHFFPENELKQFLLQNIACAQEIIDLVKAIPAEGRVDSSLLGSFYGALAAVVPHLKYSNQSHRKELVDQAKKYILEHTGCKVSDIARHCMVSESALYRIFKKEAGLTPNELIQQVRCSRAVTLLSTTNKSVQEISDILEFSSTSYFRKVLYRHTGKTPRQIRRSSQNI